MSKFSPHLYAVAAFLFFALMNVSVKMLGSYHVPLALILTFRFFTGLVLLSPAVIHQGGYVKVMRTHRIKLHLARAALGAVAVGASFHVLPLIPLGDANALGQIYPFLLLFLSAPILGEKIHPQQYLSCVVGFIGVILIASPHGQSGVVPTLLMMLSALAAAASDLVVRRLSRTESSLAIVIWFFLIAGSASFAWWFMTARDVQLSSHAILYLCMAGIFGGFAQLCLTQAFKHLGAGTMGPYSYLGFFFATVLGLVVFNEMPTWWLIAGAALIISSAQWSYLSGRSAKRALDATR